MIKGLVSEKERERVRKRYEDERERERERDMRMRERESGSESFDMEVIDRFIFQQFLFLRHFEVPKMTKGGILFFSKKIIFSKNGIFR